MLLMTSCGGTKEVVMVAPPIEEEMLDTLVVTAPPITKEEQEDPIAQVLPPYNPSATRYMDLLHTTLDLRFDWNNQWVIGTANIEMTPVFYPQSSVELDAKGFDINRISKGAKELKYAYDGIKLMIFLDRTYTRGEKVNLIIDYIAKPNEGPEGGSAAITSDKGLFFINPLGEDPNKPMQIWTQGETENNSRWYPTFDKPNERMSQQISMTVDDKYSTLSNGELISSIRNADGTRTDTWKQDKPHAPYLTMVAVGEYAVVKEEVEGLEYLYYVEEPYRPYAKTIFNHTPEMIDFFSKKLAYEYPWDKYAQVIARDYVSGAMENTGAVVFGEFVQKTGRELIDNDNDYIVAHELFHHWFGDLVTCESWANLTLQEGFANYSEYLWFEYKYGRDRADKHRMSEMQGYLMSAQNQGTHPLIWYDHPNKELMFDAHSYNKGGLVLHMLRNLVGDDAFWASLNKYLRDNEFTAVEVDELRMAFEDVTGMDLQWFFDQWYLSAGHPILEIKYEYIAEERKQLIHVDQVQNDEDHLPVYRLETEIALYDKKGNATFYPATMDTRNTTFEIENIDQPSVVVYDGHNDLLAVVNQARSTEENLALLKYSDNYIDKLKAANALKRSPLFETVLENMLNEPHEDFRELAVEYINLRKQPDQKERVESILDSDPHSSVRNAALNSLLKTDYASVKPKLVNILTGNDAYSLAATALKAMKRNNDPDLMNYVGDYEKVNYPAIVSIVADIYSSSGNGKYLGFFEDRLESVSLFAMFNFYNKYFDLLKLQSEERQIEAAMKLKEIALSGGNMFRKFVATSTINKLEDRYSSPGQEVMKIKLRKILDEIINQETDEQLQSRYRSF
ncbi:MAG: alanyl aminopeptidase [Saprospiraceae bacterium]|nr:alanyl aminopeptidase [Saprospiraceae bacterium]